MGRSVTVHDLNFVAVLKVNAAIAASIHHIEFDMQPKISILLLSDDIGGTKFATRSGGIIGHDSGPSIDGIIDDLPLDRHRGFKARSLPIDPFLVKRFPGAI